MRVVLDTNTVVSALLWNSLPRRLLQAAREGRFEVFTSAPLLAELADVLGRAKFKAKIEASGLSAEQLVRRYAFLARRVVPAGIPPVIAADPDDDALLACALAARADCIVSGDVEVQNLKRYSDIAIVSARALATTLGIE